MTHSSEKDTQPVPKIKPGDTQQLPKINPPKYNPRHKKENNTGIKFLAGLSGVVLFLGLIAYVDWATLGDNKISSEPSPPAIRSTVTETVTETPQRNPSTRTVMAEPLPGPTTTVTLFPTAESTVTATQAVTVTETYNQPVPGPTETKIIPGPTTTVTLPPKCFQDGKPITCP